MNAEIIIKKFLRNLNDYGITITLKKCISYFIKFLYENKTYRVYMIDIEELRDIPVNEIGFEFKFIDDTDLDIIKQIEDMEEWLRGNLQDILKKRSFCLVALNSRNIAAFNLVTLDEGVLPLIHYKRKLRGHEAWSEQITVKKNFRRMGLAGALRYRIFEELKKRGIRKLYGGTQLSNIASLNLARKLGFKEIADIQYLKIFNKESLHCKRLKN